MNSSSSGPHADLPIMQEVARQHYPDSALYVLATPIGNVGDISLRSLHVLAIVDAVACEDTRNTGQLLTRYGISCSLLAAHQHNEQEVAQKLIERLRAGQRIALVSDAGTPAVSDPGARIVSQVLRAGLRVIPLPGPAAVIAALSASGLGEGPFLFCGFLPAKSAQRDAVLAGLIQQTATLAFYEAPHRIVSSCAGLARHFGPEREVVLARELTKLYEQIHRCPLGEVEEWLLADPNRQKGEFVILLEGAPAGVSGDQLEHERILAILLEQCPVSQAAALAAKITGQKKNLLYQQALRMRGED